MARKSSIELKLTGFDELIKKIEQAGGSIDSTVNTCMEKSAQIAQDQIKDQMIKKKVSKRLVNSMPKYEISRNGNAITARVGFKKGKYDPRNLSDGYKAVFINYGTPRIKPREFIKAAKSKAKRQIKQVQQETLSEILEELK